MGVRANDDSATPTGAGAVPDGTAARAAADGRSPDPAATPAGVPADGPAAATPGPQAVTTAPEASAPDAGRTAPGAPAGTAPDATEASRPATDATAPGRSGGVESRTAPAPATDRRADRPGGDGVARPARASRRPPAVTRDTARPEGGGRAAPGDAPAPARQWPLLTVLGLTALGLLVVGFDPFPQAPRIGAMLIGVALLTGAALRRALPSVGMLAVRSRFTDMAAYGLLGAAIVLLSLMTQPDPWLEIPFLEDAVRFAVR